MSSTFSQELAASPSDLNEPECEPSRSARSIPIADVSSPSAGQALKSTRTLRREALSEVKRMSSQQVSPAKMFRSLETAPDLPASVLDYTGTSFEPFAWYDQESRCWRTWQRCLIEGWTKLSEIWPRSGMTRNGIAYQRAPLALLIGETESGLLPSPSATDSKGAVQGEKLKERMEHKRGVRLEEFLLRRQLPTPSAGNSHSAGRLDEWGGKTLGNAVVPQIPEIIGRAIMNSTYTTG
jgi:hypothetical protein